MLYYSFLLSRIWFHSAHVLPIKQLFSLYLLRLLGCGSSSTLGMHFEDGGFDCWELLAKFARLVSRHRIPLTQYGHRICARFTLPHAAHLFRFVRSFSAFPAMKRWRPFRCDVFFLGTALSMPSHMSDIEGILGSVREGSAIAANCVGMRRKGCERRCSSGRFTTGRTGPLRVGKSVCSSPGSGRVSAMVM